MKVNYSAQIKCRRAPNLSPSARARTRELFLPASASLLLLFLFLSLLPLARQD
jgi:hypothetical protein